MTALVLPRLSVSAAQTVSTACAHCGASVTRGQEFCCAGCQAVAQAIVDNGLADYYRHRDAMPESPREALPQIVADFGLFDHPDVQKNFVRRAEGAAGEHERDDERHERDGQRQPLDQAIAAAVAVADEQQQDSASQRHEPREG